MARPQQDMRDVSMDHTLEPTSPDGKEMKSTTASNDPWANCSRATSADELRAAVYSAKDEIETSIRKDLEAIEAMKQRIKDRQRQMQRLARLCRTSPIAINPKLSGCQIHTQKEELKKLERKDSSCKMMDDLKLHLEKGELTRLTTATIKVISGRFPIMKLPLELRRAIYEKAIPHLPDWAQTEEIDLARFKLGSAKDVLVGEAGFRMDYLTRRAITRTHPVLSQEILTTFLSAGIFRLDITEMTRRVCYVKGINHRLAKTLHCVGMTEYIEHQTESFKSFCQKVESATGKSYSLNKLLLTKYDGHIDVDAQIRLLFVILKMKQVRTLVVRTLPTNEAGFKKAMQRAALSTELGIYRSSFDFRFPTDTEADYDADDIEELFMTPDNHGYDRTFFGATDAALKDWNASFSVFEGPHKLLSCYPLGHGLIEMEWDLQATMENRAPFSSQNATADHIKPAVRTISKEREEAIRESSHIRACHPTNREILIRGTQDSPPCDWESSVPFAVRRRGGRLQYMRPSIPTSTPYPYMYHAGPPPPVHMPGLLSSHHGTFMAPSGYGVYTSPPTQGSQSFSPASSAQPGSGPPSSSFPLLSQYNSPSLAPFASHMTNSYGPFPGPSRFNPGYNSLPGHGGSSTSTTGPAPGSTSSSATTPGQNASTSSGPLPSAWATTSANPPADEEDDDAELGAFDPYQDDPFPTRRSRRQ